MEVADKYGKTVNQVGLELVHAPTARRHSRLRVGNDRRSLQVLLRWNIQNGNSVIPKSTNPSRIEENASIWDWQLNAEDFDWLSSLKTQVTLHRMAAAADGLRTSVGQNVIAF